MITRGSSLANVFRNLFDQGLHPIFDGCSVRTNLLRILHVSEAANTIKRPSMRNMKTYVKRIDMVSCICKRNARTFRLFSRRVRSSDMTSLNATTATVQDETCLECFHRALTSYERMNLPQSIQSLHHHLGSLLEGIDYRLDSFGINPQTCDG